MNEEAVLVGTIVRAHGLRGEVLVFPHTDFETRFRRGQVVLTTESRILTVASTRRTEIGVLVRFEEIADRNAAEAMGKIDLFIPAHERRPLAPGEYWPDELVGLEVRDREGRTVGTVAAIDDATAQPRLLVSAPGGQRLVPLVDALVPTIDLAGGFLVVEDLPGLLSDS